MRERRGTGFAGPLALSPWGAEGRGSNPACAGLDVPEELQPLAATPGVATRSERSTGGSYFNQPRRLKYHIGTSALATINASA